METITAADYRRLKTKRPKYGNKKVVFDGQSFDSIRERDRWIELKILEAAGEIRDLKRQEKFILVDKMQGQRAISYIADFYYKEKRTYGEWEGKYVEVVEDVKSPSTRRNPVYVLKKKLMRAKYGILIRETL